jgi:hypothetical protein
MRRERKTYKCDMCTNPCYRRLVSPPKQVCPHFPKNKTEWKRLRKVVVAEKCEYAGDKRRLTVRYCRRCEAYHTSKRFDDEHTYSERSRW